MTGRPFNGVFIPARLYVTSELSWHEKLALVDVAAFNLSGRPYFASNEHVSQHLKLSKSRASEVIKSLECKGLVTIVRCEDEETAHRRIIALTEAGNHFFSPGIILEENTLSDTKPPFDPSKPPPSKYRSPPFEISKHNNIKDNNIHTGAQARENAADGEGDAEAPEPERQPTALEADLIALAGDAYRSQAGMPKRLLLLLDDDLPCTVDELKRAVIDAAEWHAKSASGAMNHWNLAYTKAAEARDRRLSGAAGPRSGAGGGRLSGALSAKPATARKRKHGDFVAGRGEGRHELSWTGPPEVRARMVRIHGEEFTHSWLDAAGWNDGVILARNSFARDKLSALPVLSGYRIEVGVSGHAERE